MATVVVLEYGQCGLHTRLEPRRVAGHERRIVDLAINVHRVQPHPQPKLFRRGGNKRKCTET